MKENKFDEIYVNASFCLKEYYSIEKFKDAMFEAVGKLKAIDSNLNIWTFEGLDNPFPSEFYLVKGFGIGDSVFHRSYVFENENLEVRRNFAYLMTYWQKEDGLMKLTGYQVLANEDKSANFFGTSSCITTDKTETKTSNKIITKARMVINVSEERHVEKTVLN